MTNKALQATVEIEAAPERVWRLLSDLERMPEWSPQCRRTWLLGKLREGAYAVNWNRHGAIFWPTVSKIERLEPNRMFAFRILTNNSTWSFEITPTGSGCAIIERRLVPPEGTKRMSSVVVEHLLGGEEDFDAKMVDGMNITLARIKAAAERTP